MDTASWIPDLFMKRVRDGGEWTLFSPEEVPELHEIYGSAFDTKYMEYEALAKEGKLRLYKTLPATEVWRKMISMLFELATHGSLGSTLQTFVLRKTMLVWYTIVTSVQK